MITVADLFSSRLPRPPQPLARTVGPDGEPDLLRESEQRAALIPPYGPPWREPGVTYLRAREVKAPRWPDPTVFGPCPPWAEHWED